jgi:hypothetical protein
VFTVNSASCAYQGVVGSLVSHAAKRQYDLWKRQVEVHSGSTCHEGILG